MSKRFEEINFPEYKREVQLALFNIKEENAFKYTWPVFERGNTALQKVIDSPDKLVGIDLEFDVATKRCSILGLANRNYSASGPFDITQAKEIVSGAKEGRYKLVGFSINGAEKTILEHALGEELPLYMFEDTMLLFYLCNSHLTKSDGGKADYEKGTLGLINLWTCASIYTDLPMWKVCRELGCNGPCPRCDVFGYNAIDAWAGLEAFHKLLDESKSYGLDYAFYRDLVTLTYIAEEMKNQGIRVDRKLVAELENLSDTEKNKLFDPDPIETEDGMLLEATIPFNPKSPAEALKYFKENKILLDSFSKDDIISKLKKFASKEKLTLDEFIHKTGHPAPVQWLVNSALYKGLGKGLDSWFGERYFKNALDCILHPRFITTGAQTGRWSSSGPNFQNLVAPPKD